MAERLDEMTGPHAGGCNCWPHVSVSTNSPIARLIEQWTVAADNATSIPSAGAYRMCADMLRHAVTPGSGGSVDEEEPTGWDAAMKDPAFVAALDEGLADVAAGRVTPWSPALDEAWAEAEAAVRREGEQFRLYVRALAHGYEAGMALPELRGGSFVRSDHETPADALRDFAAALSGGSVDEEAPRA